MLVHDGRFALIVTSMPSPAPGSVWALWQVPRTGAPRLLGEFSGGDVRARLRLSYGETSGFAVSREPAGTTPLTPTVVVATGTTT